MARTSAISIAIYRRHIQLYRFLNDAYIFQLLIRPDIKAKAEKFGKSKSKAKKPYLVPKKGKSVRSRRRDADIERLLASQYDRGLFESLIVSVISRVEAFLVECLELAICSHPEKLAILVDEKTGIPVDMFLAGSSKEDILNEMIRLKSESLTFLPPAKYIDRLQRILSITLEAELVRDFVEAKASRDVIVHGTGIINSTYLAKTGNAARGQRGKRLQIDSIYFRHVIITAKRLSGNIASKVEAQYG